MALTPEGVLFRKRAEEIIAMVDKTEAEFTSMQNTVGGDIYIGSGETQAIRRITRIAKPYGMSIRASTTICTAATPRM